MSYLLFLPVIKEVQNCGCSVQGDHYSQATSLEILAVGGLRIATLNEYIGRNIGQRFFFYYIFYTRKEN